MNKYTNRLVFPEHTNRYRGNLHSHSTNSDGCLTPTEMVSLYKKNGYSFLCLSEHDYYTDLRSEFDTDGFILLPGLEASVKLCDAEGHQVKTHHIHGILGNRQMQEQAAAGYSRPENVLRFLSILRIPGPVSKLPKTGSISFVPKAALLPITIRCIRVDPEEVCSLQGLWAMEIYNHGSELGFGEGHTTFFWERMLKQGNFVSAFASDDNHNPPEYFDSFGGYVCVCSESLDHESIVNHLLAGDYYSSQGPEICQWGIRENHVFVECSPCSRICFVTDGPTYNSRMHLMQATPLTHAEHPLNGTESYVR
ncbi:MAG: PHP domain-containing protein, partial [Waltera sp.]